MALPKAYTLATGRIPDLFEKIRDGQAPDQLSQQVLKDWGFSSSNDRAFLPILKAIGFLSPDGKPTTLYKDYRNHSRSKAVMAQALKDAYSDLFLIKEHPTDADKDAIQGKFKSYHNVSDKVAGLMMKTFYGLLSLADLKSAAPPEKKEATAKKEDAKDQPLDDQRSGKTVLSATGLHYNIQIHLPATKDIEVYNAIFRSLKEHLFEE